MLFQAGGWGVEKRGDKAEMLQSKEATFQLHHKCGPIEMTPKLKSGVPGVAISIVA